MDVKSLFRLSFATFASNNTGEKSVVTLSPSLSLSKAEVKALGVKENESDAEIEKIKLACFWKRIGKNQFCLPDGGVVNSATELHDYYAAAKPLYNDELKQLADREEGPTYTICYKETIVVPNAKKAGDVPLDLKLHTFEHKPTEFGNLPGPSAIDPNNIATASAVPGSRPGQMGTSDWNEVVVVNNLLNGFCIDKTSQAITRARKTAFKLEPNPVHPLLFSPGTVTIQDFANLKERAKAAIELSPIKSIQTSLKIAFPHAKKDPDAGKGDGNTSEDDDASDDKDDKDEPAPPAPLEHLYPLWEVCDDSMVKIETISNTLQISSAQQGFSSMSIETAVSTSVSSITAGASAGFAASSKTASAQQTGTKTEQMHASYEFPRVRLYLDEDSISLSADCEAAIKNVESTKSYQALMNFYRDYGHLFVTKVKLGGRLRATRMLTANEAKSMASTENAWKASLAASFSSVTSNGGVSASAAGASATDDKSASTSFNDSVCWEAHGGNTTLANNPAAWCSTVENFWFWRVVHQETVLPIENVISKLPGFESTRDIFAGIAIAALFQSTPMEIMWNGADGAQLGRGISATTDVKQPGDILRDSPFKAEQSITVPVPTEPGFQWSVLSNNRSLYQYLVDTYKQTINPYISTRLFPNFVWRLALNDRAFSVVLRISKNHEKTTAKFTVNGAQPTDPQEWRKKYGDYFINSMITGSATTVVWTFLPHSPSADQFKTKEAVAAYFAAPVNSYETGCAYMAKLAIDIPCEAYMYDAYYNETRVSSPASVLGALAKRDLRSDKQVLSVGLKSYHEVDALLSVVSTTASSGVSPLGLAAVRKDQAEFTYQSIKRRTDLTAIATNDAWTNWSFAFTPARYAAGLAAPGGSHEGATGLALDYTNLFSRADTTITPRMEGWDKAYGDEGAFERLLRWMRLSRQAEATQLAAKT